MVVLLPLRVKNLVLGAEPVLFVETGFATTALI
jgi:hypothetical protein